MTNLNKIPSSIAASNHRDCALDILSAALDAIDPGKAVRRHVECSGSLLTIGLVRYDLSAINKITVLGAGKASQPMAAALYDILGDRVNQGLTVVRQGETDLSFDTGLIEVIEGSHPVPDQRSLEAGKRVIEMASRLGDGDLALVLVSGGASSLMSVPVADLTLKDLQRTTEILLSRGADIKEVNTVRKHLCAIKGGKLAQAIAPASVSALILSDVIGDDPGTVGSGPTAPDPSSFKDVLDVLAKRDLQREIPQAVLKHLEKGLLGAIKETPKIGDPIFNNVRNTIIGSNSLAQAAALKASQQKGFTVHPALPLKGEAADMGRLAGRKAIELKKHTSGASGPSCMVFGGETVVNIKGSGKGGRNQELALALAAEIDGVDGILAVALATDGSDGPTLAAGAVVTGQTCDRARNLGLNPFEYLDNNDSYSFFQSLDDLLITGPTHTNVADLLIVLVA